MAGIPGLSPELAQLLANAGAAPAASIANPVEEFLTKWGISNDDVARDILVRLEPHVRARVVAEFAPRRGGPQCVKVLLGFATSVQRAAQKESEHGYAPGTFAPSLSNPDGTGADVKPPSLSFAQVMGAAPPQQQLPAVDAAADPVLASLRGLRTLNVAPTLQMMGVPTAPGMPMLPQTLPTGQTWAAPAQPPPPPNGGPRPRGPRAFTARRANPAAQTPAVPAAPSMTDLHQLQSAQAAQLFAAQTAAARQPSVDQFATHWGLNETSKTLLRSLNPVVQAAVIQGFNLGGETDVNAALRQFAQCMVETAQTLPAAVHQAAMFGLPPMPPDPSSGGQKRPAEEDWSGAQHAAFRPRL